MRVASLLKQISAAAASGATEDQASDHTVQTQTRRDEFELNITEDVPTQDQVQTILGYLGKGKVSSVFNGVSSEAEALKRFKSDPSSFQRPVVSVRVGFSKNTNVNGLAGRRLE
jgi:serine/threonine-protein kinase RIO1